MWLLTKRRIVYGGGAVGLSDVYGAALWGLDFSLYAASTGIIKRVHFHQSIGSPYADWYPLSPQMTKAPYYGKLAAVTFMARSESLEVKTLNVGGDQDVNSGYAAYVDGKLKRLALINLLEYDGQGDRGSQNYTVDVTPNSKWTVKRLQGGSAKDKTGITFDGMAYEAETLGKPVKVEGRASGEALKADASGKLVVNVADSEAAILVKKC